MILSCMHHKLGNPSRWPMYIFYMSMSHCCSSTHRFVLIRFVTLFSFLYVSELTFLTVAFFPKTFLPRPYCLARREYAPSVQLDLFVPIFPATWTIPTLLVIHLLFPNALSLTPSSCGWSTTDITTAIDHVLVAFLLCCFIFYLSFFSFCVVVVLLLCCVVGYYFFHSSSCFFPHSLLLYFELIIKYCRC